MSYRRKVLVIRLSALGDVAIMEPVLRSVANANPDTLFVLAAPKLLQPIFDGISNLQYLPTKKESSSILYKQFSQVQPDMVADLHFINRIIGVDLLFMLHGVKVRHIIKHFHKNRPSWQRYLDVFRRCGLAVEDNLDTLSHQYLVPSKIESHHIIGIAPFAQHQGKIWPIEKMERLVELLSSQENYSIQLFGGKQDANILDSWAEKYPNVVSLAGKYSFAEELQYISKLSVMVSMDSANMHFASCKGVPVISIWGATHPSRGFYGWRQDPQNAVQLDLPCRPCSKFGNKPCRYGDYRCMNGITPETVFQKITELLGER